MGDKSYLLGNNNDPFQPNDLFGKNYESQIRDPQKQAAHQKAVGSENPATKIDFQDFDLGNQPAFAPPPQNTASSAPPIVPLQPIPANDDFGFGQAPNAANPPPVEQQQQAPKNYKIWNIEYYQFLFDVDTKQVLHRILKATIPFPPNFFEIIARNPDIYGPWWIATTCVFIMAATGNVATYFDALKNGDTEKWCFDVDKLSIAAGVIYGYLFIIPLVLWALFRWGFKIEGLGLMNILCMYGYSFFIYVPISFLTVIPVQYIRWILIAIACLISTTFIVLNFFKPLRPQIGKGFIVIIIQAALHIAFALVAALYFFKESSCTKTSN